MRKLKVILTAILVLVSVMSFSMLAACKGPAVKLDKETVSVKVGETVTVVATLEDTSATVTWTSADETIATVADGVITGIATGETTVTAKVGEDSASVKVTVAPADVVMSKSGVLTFAAASDKTVVINDGTSDVVTKTATDASFDAYAAIIDYRVANSITAEKAYTVKVTGSDFTKTFDTATFKAVGDKVEFRAMVDRADRKTDNKYFYLTADIAFVQEDEATGGYGTGYKLFCSAENQALNQNPHETVLNLDGRGYTLSATYSNPNGGDRWMFDRIIDSNIKNLSIKYDLVLGVIRQATVANHIIDSTLDNCYIFINITADHATAKGIKHFAYRYENATFNNCIFNIVDNSADKEYPVYLCTEGENYLFNNCAISYNDQQGIDAMFALYYEECIVGTSLYSTMTELLTAESAKTWPSAWDMNATSLKLAGKTLI